MEEETEIPKAFRMERARRKISQKDMAELLGIERATYATYEKGTRTPSLSLLKKFSEMSGISIDSMVKGEDTGSIQVPEKIEPLVRKLSMADDETVKQVEIFLGYWDSRKKGVTAEKLKKKI